VSAFTREVHAVNGVKTVLYSAGAGDPVVLFHGGGTVDGYDFLQPLTEKHRVIAPYHPGWGESDDDPSFTELHDYVLHYLELFDILGIEQFSLIGLSMGGHLGARFAIEHSTRIKKLILVSPAGLDDPQHPALDIIATPGEQLLPMLVHNFDTLKTRLPETPDADFIADRYRESTTYTRLFWEHPFDRKLPRHLHRIKMPTLILWGEHDRVIPVEQLQMWRRLLPHADARVIRDAGHIVQLDKPEVVDLMGQFLRTG
jgi:pimeloyl-ACP methyl ester carboxylesterase